MRRETLARLREAVAAKRPVVLATELGSGQATLVEPSLAGGDAEPWLRAAALDAVARDQSRQVDGPRGPVFLRVYNPPVRLLLVGAVHIAQALAPMSRLVGAEPLVVDPRRAFATAGRFPGVPVLAEWPEPALARLALDRRTAVVALTHDPKIDDPALAAALRSPAFYVGALGSRKTQAARRERLLALGCVPEQLARLDGPVGLDIGAVSPAEIAVAILGQLVLRLRRPAAPDPGA
jgi:xanthine dehydrogenase accessory factor